MLIDLSRARQMFYKGRDVASLAHKGFTWGENRKTFAAQLFSNGEQGTLIDAHDSAKMFQDHQGAVPSIHGLTVGMALDQKGGQLGPELVVNGDFAQEGAGWEVSVTDSTHFVTFLPGKARYVSGSTTPIMWLRQRNILEIGKTYRVDLEITEWVSGRIKMEVFGGIMDVPAGTGTRTFIGMAGSAHFGLTRQTTDVDLTIGRISIREIPGVPAIQPTVAARPTLVRRAMTERRNLLLNTEDLAAAGWGKQATTVNSHSENAPGSTSAFKLVETTTSSQHWLTQAVTLSATGIGTLTVLLKAGERKHASLQFGGANQAPQESLLFDLENGVIASASPGAVGSITPQGNGWYLCTLTATWEAVSASPMIIIRSGVSVAPYAGDGVSGIYVSRPQLEIGPTATPYQRVGANALDVTEAGVPSQIYLLNDGNDNLPWTAPAGSYDVFHAPANGPATLLTEQALDGPTNILMAETTRAYLAINRRLSEKEIVQLRAYYETAA